MAKNSRYICRIYILKGVQITSLDNKENAETYLRVNLFDKFYYDKDYMGEGPFPEYYQVFEFKDLMIPGSCQCTIDIMEKNTFGRDDKLGSTVIDLESRCLSMAWRNLEKKPVEKRNIQHPAHGSRGRLEMFIDLIPMKKNEPKIPIFPRCQEEYELRAIVWETKDCVFKDPVFFFQIKKPRQQNVTIYMQELALQGVICLKLILIGDVGLKGLSIGE